MKAIAGIILFSIYLGLCFGSFNAQAMPRDSHILFEQGIKNAKEGNLNLAKQQFKNCLSYSSEFSDNEYYYASEALAYCYYKLNQLDSANYYNEEHFFFPVDYRIMEYPDSLQSEGIKHLYSQEFNMAKENLKECIGIQNYLLGKNHFLTAKSKDWLSYIYILENNYKEAIKEKEEALEIYKLFYDLDSKFILTTSINLADLYDNIGSYEKAYNILFPTLQYLCIEDPEFFHIRNRLSRYLSISGKYEEAAEIERENINLAGLDISIELRSRCNLCEYYISQGNINKAFETINDALELCDAESLTPEFATVLNVKANLYSLMGDQLNAIQLGKQALEFRCAIYDHHPDIAMSYNNLARYYSFLSLFTNAIHLQKLCISEYEYLGYNNTTEMAAAYNNYSDYLANKGDLEEAIEIQLKAMDLLYNLYDTAYHPDYAIALNNLSRLYYLQKDYKKAIEKELEVVDIRKQIFNECHTDIASAYSNLATISLACGEYKMAMDYCNQSLEIYKSSIGGQENADYVRGLALMAEIYTAMADFDKAIETLHQTEEYYLKQFGENSPAYIDYAQSIAVVCHRAGQNELATKYISEIERIIDDYTLDTFSCLTSNERTQFWDRNKTWYVNYLPYLALGIKNPIVLSTLYNSLLTSKGILLGTEIEIEKIIISSRDEGLINRWNVLKSLRGQLEYDYNRAPNTEGVDIEILVEKIKDLEHEIISATKKYGDFSEIFRITWEEVQSFLEDDEAAIEFCTVPTLEGENRYIALLITPSCRFPILIDLFNEQNIIWPNGKNKVKDLENFYDLVWEPIIKETGNGISKLYFSPAGKFYNTAIEYARIGDSFLSDTITLYRLSSTREILELKKQNQNLSKAVVYGGLKYEYDVKNPLNEHIKIDSVLNEVISRNSFDYLPGTLTEIEKITDLLESCQIEFKRFSGHEGTEETFYELNGTNTNVVHLATHGFYYKSVDDSEWISRIMSEYPPQLLTYEDASLCRTGIILSNAKEGLSNLSISNRKDGILTAKEISDMNLTGLSLTVLSACQTGQGDITDDGVLGLQRGFKKAGARALLMSLWDVSDEATLFLMEYFYKFILSGMSYHDALFAAQAELRNYKNGKYDHPKYWAAFILLDSL